jgi:hypothetical protein
VKDLLGNKKEIENRFQWKDKKGNNHNPEQMGTYHLFCTLRMVWNHYMPEDAKIWTYNQYTFGSFYTNDYMKNAVLKLGYELNVRNDIKHEWQKDIDLMIDYLNKNDIKKINSDKLNLL